MCSQRYAVPNADGRRWHGCVTRARCVVCTSLEKGGDKDMRVEKVAEHVVATDIGPTLNPSWVLVYG